MTNSKKKSEIMQLAFDKLTNSDIFCVITSKDGATHINSYGIPEDELENFFTALSMVCRNKSVKK